MPSTIEDRLNLESTLIVGDTNPSSRLLAEEMFEKYDSQVDQYSSCDLECLMNALPEDQFSSVPIQIAYNFRDIVFIIETQNYVIYLKYLVNDTFYFILQ